MWAKKLAAMLAAAVIFFSAATPAFAENNAEWYELYSKIEKNRDARGLYIENNVIFVIGFGAGPKGANPKGSFYKSFARRAAMFDALRKLAEAVKGVEIEAEGKEILEYDTVIIKLDVGDFKNVRQVGEAKFFENGVCEIVLEMPLF